MNNIQGIGIQYNNNIGYNGVFKYGVNYNQMVSFAQLMKSAGSDLYLDARKANGISQGINSPLVNPWVDLTKNGNNATFQNIAGTTSDGWDLQTVVNSNGSVIDYANLVVNGDFSNGTTGWNTGAGSSVVSSKVFTATGNGSLSTITVNPASSISILTSEIFNGKVKVRVRGVGCTNIRVRFIAGFKDINIPNPVVDQWYTISDLATAGSGLTTNAITITATYPDGATQNGKQVEIDGNYGVLFHKLTGNTGVQAIESQLSRQLTALECDRIFPFVATTGQTKVSARPFLKLDGADTVGIIPNNPSVDIVGLDEFEIDMVILTPSVLTNSYVICKNLSTGTDQQYAMFISSTGNVDLILNGIDNIIAPNGTLLPNSLYNINAKRQSGRLIGKINNVETYNQPNVQSLITQPNLILGARSTNASGTTRSGFFGGYIGALSIAKNPDFTKLSSAWNKVVKDYI